MNKESKLEDGISTVETIALVTTLSVGVGAILWKSFKWVFDKGKVR